MSEPLRGENGKRCPYCGEDMKRGYIRSSHMMHWEPEKESGYTGKKIRLTKPTWKSMVEGILVESFYCEICRKMILSIN